MARPIKNGIDYFPFDTSLDTKFELIEAEYGLTGFAIIVKLFQKIYGEQGYYCEWTNEVALLFSRKVGEGYNVVSEIVSAAIKRGIFDKDLYDKYQILTSKGIQERYFEAVSRRVKINVEKTYLLVKVAQNNINVCKNSVNVNRNSKNVYRNTQSKLKESKQKESKVDSSAPPEQTTKLSYGEYKNVILTSEELKKLNSDFSDAEKRINRLSEYMASTGKNYKSHYATIRMWAKKDKPLRQNNPSYETEKIKQFINKF